MEKPDKHLGVVISSSLVVDIHVAPFRGTLPASRIRLEETGNTVIWGGDWDAVYRGLDKSELMRRRRGKDLL